MKKIFTLLASLFFPLLYAQAPPGFNYQATVKDAAGQLVLNQNVNFRFSIKQGTNTSIPLYVETHQVPTDNKSQVNLIIGQGTASVGSFAQIDWSLTPLFLGVELNTGSGYVTVASSDLISVPYALYANKAGSTLIPSIAEVLQNGNDANAKKITNLAPPVDPKDGVNIEYLATLKNKLDNQALKIKSTNDSLIKKGFIEPQIEWEKEIQSPYLFNRPLHFCETKNKDIIILGLASNTSIFGYEKIILNKITTVGDIIWQKEINNFANSLNPNKIIETNDFGIVISGTNKIVKFDINGNEIWSASAELINGNFSPLSDVFETTNGDLIYTSNSIVYKFNKDGILIWKQQFDNYPTKSINKISTTSSGGIIISGKIYSSIQKDFDAWVVNLDSGGRIIWTKEYGDNLSDKSIKVIETKDNNFLFIGLSSSNVSSYNLWIVKINSIGNVIWEKKYESNIWNRQLQSIDQLNDGGFLIVYNIGDKIKIEKASNNGQMYWNRSFNSYNTYWNEYSNANEISEKSILIIKQIPFSRINADPITKIGLVKLSYKQ